MFFLPTKINLGDLKINEIGLGSSLSVGTAKLIARNSFCKKNQGFGQQSADQAHTEIPVISVLDEDFIDSVVFHNLL